MHRTRVLASAFLIALLAATPMASGTGDLQDAGNIDVLMGRAATWVDIGGDKVAYLTTTGTLQVHSFDEGVHTLVFEVTELGDTWTAAVGSTGNLIAVGSDDGVYIINIALGGVVDNFTTPFPVTAIAWDVDGDIWVGHGGGTRSAVEYRSGVPTGASTSAHQISLTDIVILSDGRIVTSGNDKKIFVDNLQGEGTLVLSDHSARVLALAVDTDGNLLSSSADGKLIRHDTVNWSTEVLFTDSSSNLITYILPEADEIHIGADNGVYHSVDVVNFTTLEDYSIGGQIRGVKRGVKGELYLIAALTSSTSVRLFDTDVDGDGVLDSQDAFPEDPEETEDSDFDGVGDNGDDFPDDPSEHSDSDGDGVGDNSDMFPNDANETTDTDGDGIGDNGDAFADDATQWEDTDNDGLGDNPDGSNPDQCPAENGGSQYDRKGCIDSDGDGWSDPDASWPASPNGSADAFPDERSQWADSDGDGHGDDPSGYKGDACPSQVGNSRYSLLPIISNESGVVTDWKKIDQYGCPDGDGDGYADHGDHLPEDADEYMDFDGDGVGAKSDYDDTNAAVQTHDDWCLSNPDDVSSHCSGLKDPEYLAYVEENEAGGEIVMDYYSWVASKNTNKVDDKKSEDKMEENIKTAATYGGLLFVGLVALLLIVNGMMKMGRKRSFSKTFGDSSFSPTASLAELAAHEAGESFESSGGVIEEDGWGDEISTMNIGGATSESDSSKQQSSMSYDDEESIEALAQTDSVAEPEKPAPKQTPPEKAPPLPDEGLPPGWTDEQWKWYGHEWLAKNR